MVSSRLRLGLRRGAERLGRPGLAADRVEALAQGGCGRPGLNNVPAIYS
jgi:hypothetical protein